MQDEQYEDVNYGYTLKDILLSRIVQDGLVQVDSLDAPMGPVYATAQRIAAELEALQMQHSQMNNVCTLQALEVACIENNARAIELFCYTQYGRVDTPRNPYNPLIKILHEICRGVDLPQLGRNPTMIAAHTLTGKKGSKTLETARYELLQSSYAQLLSFESGLYLHKDEPEVLAFKKEQTIQLVKLLMLGIPEGQFPHVANTLLVDAGTVFFEKIWMYFEEVFYNRPLSRVTYLNHHHYDTEFYDFCKKLLAEQKIGLWEVFTALKSTYPDPQHRLVELFRALDAMIEKKIILTSEQLQFKSLLKKIAQSYGFQESDVKALSYNTCQKRLSDARERWNFFNSSRESGLVAVSPQKKVTVIEKVLLELLGTEFNFLREMHKFVGSDDVNVKSSLKALMGKLSGLRMSEVQREQLKIVESFYASLFYASSQLYETLSRCMNSESNMVDKLNVLFSDIVGSNKHDFTDFMLRLVMSSIFSGKFVQVLKPLLGQCDPSAAFGCYEDTMNQSFQLLSKINETLKTLVIQIEKRKLEVISEEQYERQVDQARLMSQRVSYFLSVAEKLRLLICDQEVDPTLQSLLDSVRDEYYRDFGMCSGEEMEGSPRLLRSRRQHYAQRPEVTHEEKNKEEALLGDLKKNQVPEQLKARREQDVEHPLLLERLQAAKRTYHERRQVEFEGCLGVNNDRLFFEHCPRWVEQWGRGELRLDEVLQTLTESISSDHEEVIDDALDLLRLV